MADLTPQLLKRLQAVSHTSITIDQAGQGIDKQEITDYDALCRLKYCTVYETGAGGRMLIYTITEAGKKALESTT